MKKLFLLFFLPTLVFAHGPTRQQVVESIIIDAPPDKVWALVGDFTGLHKWHPAVKSTKMLDDKTRLLTLGDGNTITEKLLKLENDAMKLKYKITDMTTIETFEFTGRQVKRQTLPVNTYTATLKVDPEGNGSKVTWKGKFYRAYMLNPPTPEGMSDKDAVEAITGVYKSGLENLKTMLEK